MNRLDEIEASIKQLKESISILEYAKYADINKISYAKSVIEDLLRERNDILFGTHSREINNLRISLQNAQLMYHKANSNEKNKYIEQIIYYQNQIQELIEIDMNQPRRKIK